MNLDSIDLSDKFQVKMLNCLTNVTHIQRTDLLHFIFSQGEIPECEVFFNSFLVGRFRNDSYPTLNIPTQNELGGGFAMGSGDILEHLIFKRFVATTSRWRPSFGLHIIMTHRFQGNLLSKIRVNFHLIYHRLDFDSFTEVSQNIRVKNWKHR